MSSWLTVIGIGEDGLNGLSDAARRLLDGAETVFGGARHLAMLPPGMAERVEWPSPFAQGIERLKAMRGRRVCVLASGDPMWFGIGATLTRHFEPEEMLVLPHPGAFSLAAARLGWPLQDCLCLTVHGRPVEALALHLFPGAKLLILSENGRSPDRIADLLRKRGFGPSLMTVLEHLGGERQSVLSAPASSWDARSADLNLVAVECRAAPGSRAPSRIGGLPDEAFEHDGQLTKREIRAVTMSTLAPRPGELLWDIGAGSGSIAIEWMRAGGRAVALEKDSNRLRVMACNAANLGVPGLSIIPGEAPGALADLGEAPDAVFVGGGVSVPGLLEACWNALKPGGRLVANAVTVQGEAALLSWHQAQGGDLTRLSVSRLKQTGGFQGWAPLRPVTQYHGEKP
ncbi:precorrin-6y C5,15-methyltransferase (decarboxylating) subunit CbiE [Telmatospirillum sp. J64-1]|uniref:precorrin-6y C5,15-methyltransferase (decarboxylating) subunit CbiE n=1 Tax=Telmatospirillum sp. J64-1 TaxID=2502183 RepID=UPI00115CAEFA|nr:precorrin-6y C5,15-methyltransferase (decarboxylating) subunit CbiE [Telmatospirillum sp. J64-1]